MRGFTVPTLISDEAMRDIVTTGFESGGYGSLKICKFDGPTKAPAGWEDDQDYRHTWQWANGNIRVIDRYGDKKQGTINRRTLKRGLRVLQEKYPHLLAALVSGQYDVIPADALLQAAAFGDVIYG